MQIPKPLIEATKEALRVVVIAVIPILITQIQQDSIDINIVIVTGAIALLRFVDKYLHEVGKENDNTTLIKGLTRF